MRTLIKPHWSLRYAWDKAVARAFELQDPTAPWLARGAVDFLERWLRTTDRMVEFGSGRSTSWFASRCGRLVSFEDDPEWGRRTVLQLDPYPHARVIMTPRDEEGYMRAVRENVDFEPTIVLVDGQHRDAAALWALDVLSPCGMLVIDNANWFLPSRVRAPSSVPCDAKPVSARWETFLGHASKYRQLWFDNGVQATLVMLY